MNPPQSRQAERALLGACIIDGEAARNVVDRIAEDDFADRECRVVYSAVRELVRSGSAIDVVTISDKLEGRMDEAGGYAGLCDLVSDTPSSLNYESYLDIILANATYRALQQAASGISSLAGGGRSPQEALSEAERLIMAIGKSRASGRFSDMSEVMDETLSRLQVMQAGGSSGVPTGIASIDSIVGGWQKGNLVIIAARPSVGKTALATAMAANAAIHHGKSVAIFSMEMSREEIGSRLLSSLSGVSLHDIRHGLLDMSSLTEVIATAKSIKDSKLRVEDSSINSPGEMRSKCRRLAQEHGLDMIIVDYLQLMAPDKHTKDGNRVYDVADISRGLKALARELDIPVVALSQLSRSSEYRENNEPKLSDLRDSGAIEQDADVVLMLWRSNDVSLDVSTEPVHCKIAKHRNGPTGRAELLFHRPTATFRGA